MSIVIYLCYVLCPLLFHALRYYFRNQTPSAPLNLVSPNPACTSLLLPHVCRYSKPLSAPSAPTRDTNQILSLSLRHVVPPARASGAEFLIPNSPQSQPENGNTIQPLDRLNTFRSMPYASAMDPCVRYEMFLSGNHNLSPFLIGKCGYVPLSLQCPP
ncbi:hypothetical protein BS47DRAFT_520506 [Hydnum rufescens UP504]|uniref:Uncharacterized protein n=1 Tax=Hydnum rufescens UP504 TaxID=1448309 RepID=A0A9P6AIN1_9AGAM|nr:hypothetical protein BS47DRAFT_520506 [Hydnum rufescens UP504]